MDCKVAIAKCESYTTEELENCIRLVCENSDMPEVKGKTVLLKVNILSDADPSKCITTNPHFVQAVIRYLKEKGVSKVIVGDSPGMPSSGFCGKGCKIYDVCQEEGAIWADFQTNPDITKIAGTNTTMPIAHAIKEADLIFSLPKFKTHQLMYTTGAVKNMFGTIVGINKSKCHLLFPSKEAFAEFLCNLNRTVKTDFAIMDGVIGMEGAGPANGNPRAVNLILASNNSYALDYAQATVMGYDTNDIPILKEANKRKLIPSKIVYSLLDASEIVIKDFKKVAVSKRTHFLRRLVIPFVARTFFKTKPNRNPSPDFNSGKCILCKRCVNICPPKALSVKDNKITIDTNLCIRCYCCHEMCPINAISVGETK